jgi:hypothetical protein
MHVLMRPLVPANCNVVLVHGFHFMLITADIYLHSSSRVWGLTFAIMSLLVLASDLCLPSLVLLLPGLDPAVIQSVMQDA